MTAKKTTKKKGDKKHPKSLRQSIKQTVPWAATIFLVLLLLAGSYMMLNWPEVSTQPSVTTEHHQLPPQPETVPPAEELEQPDIEQVLRPKVAIIMDDLGVSALTAQQALAIPIPMALAIIPGLADSQEIMHLAHQQQRETLIHIPMEPISYPRNNPGPLGLFIQQTPEQIADKIKHMIKKHPYVIGGNNHMGSAFTQHADKMEPVLVAMKQAGLFFIDSLTSANSVAYNEAQRLGLDSAIRDVFLDNVRDVEEIGVQLQRLVSLAHKNGSAIAICHPYPQTITALNQFSQQAEQLGVDVVPISQLVHSPKL